MATWGAGFTFFLLTTACGLLYLTLGLGPVARQVPLLVVVPLVGLLTLQLSRDLRLIRSSQPGQPTSVLKKAGGPRFLLAWMLSLPVLVQILGIVWGCGLFALGYLRFQSREPWRLSLTAAALTTLAMWTLFSVILGIF